MSDKVPFPVLCASNESTRQWLS